MENSFGIRMIDVSCLALWMHVCVCVWIGFFFGIKPKTSLNKWIENTNEKMTVNNMHDIHLAKQKIATIQEM